MIRHAIALILLGFMPYRHMPLVEPRSPLTTACTQAEAAQRFDPRSEGYTILCTPQPPAPGQWGWSDFVTKQIEVWTPSKPIDFGYGPISPALIDRHVMAHEDAQVWDHNCLTPTDQATFDQVRGDSGDWWGADRPQGAEQNGAPYEDFAEVYADWATGDQWDVTYRPLPTAAQIATITPMLTVCAST